LNLGLLVNIYSVSYKTWVQALRSNLGIEGPGR